MQREVRVADNRTRGVWTFYFPSTTKAELTYPVQFIRRAGMRRWYCGCNDYIYRRMPRRRHCLHLKAMNLLVKQVGGVTKAVAEIRKGIVVINVEDKHAR